MRVWKKDEESPGLAVTRTMGDLLGHSIGVLSEPDVEYWRPNPEDYFIVLGSDGVWDVLSSAEAVGFLIREVVDLKSGCYDLVRVSRDIWEYQNALRK